MKQFYLTSIITKDKLQLDGMYYEPKKKAKKAILWMHGLSATFHAGIELFDAMSDACEREGWGFAHFNNRGHDLVAGVRKMDGTPPYGYSYYPAGAGAEVFTESVLDIDAGVDFLVQQGFSEIILVGHSTGANKACYWAATQTHKNVVGVVLSGPISDRLGNKDSSKHLAHMKQLVASRKGNQLMVGYHFFPITPKRYVSLFSPRSAEDVFDYGDPEPKLETFSKIQYPLLVIIGGTDEAADRPIEEIKKTFDSHATSSKYTSLIIPGALHRFTGHEQEATRAIIFWAKTI